MSAVRSNSISLSVDTTQLTKALRHLCKFEKSVKRVQLTYRSKQLVIAMGRTLQEIQAAGAWPEGESIVVVRRWAEALAKNPYEAALTTLQLSDGKLTTRDFTVECSSTAQAEEDEQRIKRFADLDHAFRILKRYRVSMEQLENLLAGAEKGTAMLWGPSDGRLIDDVADLWTKLVLSGVESSDIRRLFDRKSRELWNSGGKYNRDAYGAFTRYNVTRNDLCGPGRQRRSDQSQAIGIGR